MTNPDYNVCLTVQVPGWEAWPYRIGKGPLSLKQLDEVFNYALGFRGVFDIHFYVDCGPQ